MRIDIRRLPMGRPPRVPRRETRSAPTSQRRDAYGAFHALATFGHVILQVRHLERTRTAHETWAAGLAHLLPHFQRLAMNADPSGIIAAVPRAAPKASISSTLEAREPRLQAFQGCDQQRRSLLVTHVREDAAHVSQSLVSCHAWLRSMSSEEGR